MVPEPLLFVYAMAGVVALRLTFMLTTTYLKIV